MEGENSREKDEFRRIREVLLTDEIHFVLSCGIKPLGYQSDFLLDNSDRIIFVGGRQIGKTTMVSLKALYNALKNPNWLVLVLAPTFRQSKIVFDKMREILLATVWISEVDRMTQTSIYLKNGSRILCLPSGHTGESIRGYSANLIIIDEGAYVPEEVYVAIVPSLSATGGKLWMIGTPAGKCYSEDTEILTIEGWKRFSDITKEDLIATKDENGKLTYLRPVRIQKYFYKGKMLHFRHRFLDLLVTPDHSLWVGLKGKKVNGKKAVTFRFEEARNFLDRKTDMYFDEEVKFEGNPVKSIKIPRVPIFHRAGKDEIKEIENKNEIKELRPDLFFEWLGFFLAEGNIIKKNKTYRVVITHNTGETFNKMESISRELFGGLVRVKKHGKNGRRIVICSKQLYSFLKNMKTDGLPFWIRSADKSLLRKLIFGFYLGDGDLNRLKKTEGRTGRIFIGKKEYKKLADDIQEILLKLGYYSAVYYDKKNNLWTVSFTKNKRRTKLFSKRIKEVSYEGMVYDVTLPKHHRLLVRRNGKPVWSGNCGFFWGAWNSKEFSKHHATMYDNKYISRDFIEELRNAYTEIQFQQEVLGQFVEEVDTWYPPKLVRECAIGDWKNSPEEGKEYYLGVDVARYGGDETAYVVIEKDKDRYRMVWYQTTAKKPLTDVVGRIKDLHSKWNFSKIFIDETGIGAGPVDDLKESLGSVVEGVNFNVKSKSELHKNQKYLMEKGRLILLNDPKVRIQFSSIRYEYTSGGNLKIIKSEEKAIDDIVDASALAVSIEMKGKGGCFVPKEGLGIGSPVPYLGW